MPASIQYTPRSEIDISKWDACIDASPNGLVYAYSYYLDAMSKNWDALIGGDYETVMPLTWNKKYGIYYLYQPAFTASLGVFGKKLDAQTVADFIQAIPKKFKLIEISLNAGNALPAASGVSIQSNYMLDLNKSYEALYNGYRDNIKRNIKKSVQLGCRYKTDINVDEVIALSKEQMQKVSNVSNEDYKNFKNLYQLLHQKGEAITTAIYSAENNLLASAVYFFSHHRAYYIMVGNHPNGKTLGASHYLIDRFIHEHANQNLLLDFEGSDIRNLAFFYSSFGASVETYSALRINRLPWWIKLFKV